MKYWLRSFFIYFFAVCVGCFPYTCLANELCDLEREGRHQVFGDQPVPTYLFKENKVDSDCDVNIKGRLWIREKQDISINSVWAESLENRGKLRAKDINVYNSAAPAGASTWTCLQNEGEIEAESIRAECSNSGAKKQGPYWGIANDGIIKAKDVFGKAWLDGVRATSIPEGIREQEMEMRKNEVALGVYKIDRAAERKALRNTQDDMVGGGKGIYEVDQLMGVSEEGGGIFISGGYIKAKTVIGISKNGAGIKHWQEHGGGIKAKKVKSLKQSWYPDQDGKHIPIVKRNRGDEKNR